MDVVPGRRAVRSWAGLAARYARTADPDVQPLVNLKVFVKSGGWPRSMVPPDEYRLWTYQALANGAGLKLPVFGTLAQDDKRNLPAVRDAFALIERHPDVYARARPVAPVALVWPGRTFDHWPGPAAETDGAGGAGGAEPAAHAFDGLYSALVEEHVPFDVLADAHLTPERLTAAGYGVLLLPSAVCLSDVAVRAVTGYVRSGGGLLLTGWTGWRDEWGRRRDVPALEDVAGVRPLSAAPLAAPGLYLAPGVAGEDRDAVLAGLEGAGLITDDGPLPALTARAGDAQVALLLVRHGRVLPVEAIDEPTDTGCAGLVLASYGEGRVATLAAPVDALYWRWRLGDHRRLLGSLTRWCAGSHTPGGLTWPVETMAPATVEVTLSRRGRDRVVHFVNATGAEPLAEVTPVSPGTTRVRLDPGERCTGARRLVAGGTLATTQRGVVVDFELPELAAYEAVVLGVAPARGEDR